MPALNSVQLKKQNTKYLLFLSFIATKKMIN